jgi:hypothetical protein
MPIITTINSPSFYTGLADIADNFFNLKQEIQIRDLLVRCINASPLGYKAIAEQPRQNGNSVNQRADLAIYDPFVTPPTLKYVAELKFQYPADLFNAAVLQSIQQDAQRTINGSMCTHFVLIIQEAFSLTTCPFLLPNSIAALKYQIAPGAPLPISTASQAIAQARPGFTLAHQVSIKNISSYLASKYTFLIWN